MTADPGSDAVGAVLDGERPVKPTVARGAHWHRQDIKEWVQAHRMQGSGGLSPTLAQRGEPTSVGIGHRGRAGTVTPSGDVGEGKEWDPGGDWGRVEQVSSCTDGLVGAGGAGQCARRTRNWRYTRQTPCAGQLRSGEPRTRPSPSDYKGGGMGHRDGESCPRTYREMPRNRMQGASPVGSSEVGGLFGAGTESPACMQRTTRAQAPAVTRPQVTT